MIKDIHKTALFHSQKQRLREQYSDIPDDLFRAVDWKLYRMVRNNALFPIITIATDKIPQLTFVCAIKNNEYYLLGVETQGIILDSSSKYQKLLLDARPMSAGEPIIM